MLSLLALSASAEFNLNALPRNMRSAVQHGVRVPVLGRLTADLVAKRAAEAGVSAEEFLLTNAAGSNAEAKAFLKGLKASQANKKRQFEPSSCAPDGTTLPAVEDAVVEIDLTVSESAATQFNGYFTVEGPTTVRIEPQVAYGVSSYYGTAMALVNSCYSSTSQAIVEEGEVSYTLNITETGTVGVQVSISVSTCPEDDDINPAAAAGTQDCAKDGYAPTVKVSTCTGDACASSCSACGEDEFCNEGTCTCDNFAGACFDRTKCGPIDPPLADDGYCPTFYNDKGCCTKKQVEDFTDQIVTVYTGLKIDLEEHEDCFKQFLAPECAQMCRAEEVPADGLTLCKEQCEELVSDCEDFAAAIEEALEGFGEGTDDDMCEDAPTEDCFSSASALTVSVLAVAGAFFA